MSAAVEVAEAHGLEVQEPRVLSDRSNLLVQLPPSPVVARAATSTADVRAGGARDWLARDVALAAFLAARGAGVVPTASELPAGPHVRDGLAITFWRRVEQRRSRPASPREAGEALRRLHEPMEDFPGELPPFTTMLDECALLIDRLERSSGAAAAGAGRPYVATSSHASRAKPRSLGTPTPGSRAARPSTTTPPLAVSRATLERMRTALDGLRSAIDAAALPPRPLHGDASRSNLLRSPTGLLWTDFEDTCAGPAEWDLACLALSTRPYAADALQAYGSPPNDDALEPFLETRGLQGALWTALLAERHPELRAQAEARLSRWAARR